MDTPYLFQLPKKERKELFRSGEEQTRWPAYVLEKDYFVTLALKLLFEELAPQHQSKTNTPFLFKGGTTLSKVYGCIERMSEDIDLSLHRDFLECPDPGNVSGNQFKKYRDKLDDSARDCISSVLVPYLQERLKALDPQFEVSVADNALDMIVVYPRFSEDEPGSQGYIKPRVLIECGGKAGFEPYQRHTVSPIALSELGIQKDQCSVDVLGSDRTFFEKLTAVHELNSRGAPDFSARQSRHLYDLVSINAAYPDHIHDRELLQTVVEHKARYFRRQTARWDLAEPGTLNIIPQDEMKEHFRQDWNKMSDMFPMGLPYPFDTLVDELQTIDACINSV